MIKHAALLLTLAAASLLAQSDPAVKVIAPSLLHVGKAELPLYLSADWSRPQPQITRALLIFHGKQRNASDYNRSGQKAIQTAQAGAFTLLITPQFLGQQDVDAFNLPPDILRWAPEAWMGGNDAIAPAPISSFEALDTILTHLADRSIFPNLKTVVLAGHSGGAQVLQRYSIVGKAPAALAEAAIGIRYVVANPSSYLYFTPERPLEDGTFGIPRKSCYGKYNQWKYGVEDPPPYVGAASFADLEARFVTRDVIYLLGTKDIDPNHPALDKSCAGEDEGAYRYIRGHNYFRYLTARHPALTQRLWDVQGVAHDDDKMLNSPCGLYALFGIGHCPSAK